MYCVKCGKEIEEGKVYCEECEIEKQVIDAEVVVEEQPKEEISNGKALGFGIASLACGVEGICCLSIPPLALALGIVAVVLSKKSLGTRWHKFAKAGRITGKVSLIAGAVLTGLCSIWLSAYMFVYLFYILFAFIVLLFGI